MNEFKIAGLKMPIYITLCAIIILTSYLGVMPTGMVGAFLFLIVFGELLNLLGNKLPIIKTYLGGGAIVSIFGGAAIVYFKLFPTEVLDNVSTFMKDGGFLDFYISALITGSILGMNRKLLIKAAIRYLPCIISSVVFAIIFVAIGSLIVGIKYEESVAYIAIPIMGGGMGAGAVPIATVFESALGIAKETILARLVPAVALGNAMAIVAGGLLNRLGKVKPILTGNGQLVISDDDSLKSEKKEAAVLKKPSDYMSGIAVATGFFAFGALVSLIIGKLGLNIHTYAWMIISVAVVKVTGLFEGKVEEVCEAWYNFVAKNFTAALMLGIGMAYTNLSDIIDAFTISYFVLVLFVVFGAILGAAIMGRIVGFYPIEAAITAGLCMANMGGTGDVAVLQASDRMELMPFAQISSRLGGAFIILLASFLVPIFFG
ncbi:MAG: 2-hydroxycarboxylate transporter family protein [Tissierellia bacterium]|nr:2-hydroxycarboxylate transporter family protein [Tissierellia bacterium]